MGHGLMAPTQVPLGGARYGTTIDFLCPLFNDNLFFDDRSERIYRVNIVYAFLYSLHFWTVLHTVLI